MATNTNRKKVRGWRRRVREIERWRELSSQLDLDALMRWEAVWVKIPADPWRRRVRRNPPMWYRRLLLAALIEIHARWHALLAPLGIPFILRVWLMHPRFHSSQVVVAIGTKMEYYANLFLSSPDDDPAPLDLYRSPDVPLDELVWRPGIDFEPLYAWDCEPGDDEECDEVLVHLLDCGTAWVGERRER